MASDQAASAQSTAQEGGPGGSGARAGNVLTIAEFLEISTEQLGLLRELLEQRVKDDAEAGTTASSEALDEVGLVDEGLGDRKEKRGDGEGNVGGRGGREAGVAEGVLLLCRGVYIEPYAVAPHPLATRGART